MPQPEETLTSILIAALTSFALVVLLYLPLKLGDWIAGNEP